MEYFAMTQAILADVAASITELKKNPMAAVRSAEGHAVAILNHNKAEFYCVPAELYEQMLDRLDDIALADIIRKREGQKEIEVDLDDL
jgi:antitoxin StbD